MCFTPIASISTAIIEFGIALYLLREIKDRKLYPLFVFVLLLGVYQFSEFMLCTSTDPEIWARLGFVAYTFLPILVYHLFINLSGTKAIRELYIMPSVFAAMAVFLPNFIIYTSCNFLHVTVENLIFNQNPLLMAAYVFYYLAIPLYGVYIFSKKVHVSRSGKMKFVLASFPVAFTGAMLYLLINVVVIGEVYSSWIHTSVIILLSSLILIVLGFTLVKRAEKYFALVNLAVILSSFIVSFFLYFLIPRFTDDYASIFCQFALLYALASVLVIKATNGRVPRMFCDKGSSE